MTSLQIYKAFSGFRPKYHTSGLIHVKNNCSDFTFNYDNLFLQYLSKHLMICEVAGEYWQDWEQKYCVNVLGRAADIVSVKQPVRTQGNTSGSWVQNGNFMTRWIVYCSVTARLPLGNKDTHIKVCLKRKGKISLPVLILGKQESFWLVVSDLIICREMLRAETGVLTRSLHLCMCTLALSRLLPGNHDISQSQRREGKQIITE